jgi:hypothetical protein
MSYVTVFEISQQLIPLWLLLYVLILGLIGTVIFLMTRDLGPVTTVARYLMFLFACLLVTLNAYFLLDRRQSIRAYQSGKYVMVEGPIEHYSWRGKTECFRVRGVDFCHGTTPVLEGFHQSGWHGGLIGESMPVRVAYYSGVILRLDIGTAPNR